MRQLAAAVLCVALTLSSSVYAADAQTLKSDRDKVGYSIGMDIGSNLKNQQIEIDPEALSIGLKDSYRGGKTALTEEEAQRTIKTFQQQMAVKQQEMRKKLAEKNRLEGEKFLAENARKEGVKTLPSGLQYKVLKPGTGKSPKAIDSVKVNVKGNLLDGTVIESIYEGEEWMPGDPVSFEVSTAIAGWKEALPLMKEGAKWQLVVPPNLAYGERGDGRNIGPEATLIYELELLSIEK
ncbi:MAG TPA: FKBP-type peptidyl-prolyl cis-trans isomerase [Candidatus Deferrimicrobium sp.]